MSYGKCGMKPRLTPPIISMPDVKDKQPVDIGDCDTDGHVWEVAPNGKLWKCTFCGKLSVPEARAEPEPQS